MITWMNVREEIAEDLHRVYCEENHVADVTEFAGYLRQAEALLSMLSMEQAQTLTSLLKKICTRQISR